MTVTIHQGDALAVLRTLPANSVQVCVTSPPYYRLRSYLSPGHPDKARELGGEQTPAQFIDALLAVFDEVRRVLRPDGLCWVNIGDSYAGSGKGPTGSNGIGDQEQRQGFTGVSKKSTLAGATKNGLPQLTPLGSAGEVPGIPAKNLLLIPERFAIDMQERGWIVRSRICWAKTSAMPESVRDRPTSAWEHIWLFSRARAYYYDAEAVRQPLRQPEPQVAAGFGGHKRNGGATYSGNPYDATALTGANLRNYWLLGPEPVREAHYATYPTELVRRCVLASTSAKGACPACGKPWRRVVERVKVGSYHDNKASGVQYGYRQDGKGPASTWTPPMTLGWEPGCTCPPAPPVPCVVLDPFLGSGTTALVADRLGRAAIGCELNPKYADMARRRIEKDAGFLADIAVVPA